MREPILVSLRVAALTLLITGILYPMAVYGVGKALFPSEAAGSLVSDAQGKQIGSRLIAQPFAKAAYFQPRPSAAGDKGYDATSSGGSNLGPTSKKLRDRVEAE